MNRQFGLFSLLTALTVVAAACAPAAAPLTGNDQARAVGGSASSPLLPSSDEQADSGGGPSVNPEDFEPIVEPDPDYERNLSQGGFNTSYWRETDFSLHSISYDEILSGGPPPDGITPIDEPKFATIKEANEWLADLEPVIALEINGVARAYPLQILIWHEIVNDEIGGVPVSVTFCPLCNSAITFDRRLEGVVLDFGTSGNLRNSDLIMYDRQTKSWWQQFTGEGIVGVMTGRVLTVLPSTIVSWGEFKAAHPDAEVLSQDTGFARSYGRNPYAGYDEANNPPFLYRGDLDGRLLPKERVAAVTIQGVDIAFPFTLLEKEPVVNYSANGVDLVVFFTPDTQSALDRGTIQASRSVGATGIFSPYVGDRKLTFESVGNRIVDTQTQSEWNILGQAVTGELAGTRLEPIVHANHFWFSWAAFKPATTVYQGPPA